jgi:hypothetical protein
VHLVLDSEAEHGSGAYYLLRLGGVSGLARLYLEAGLLYLEGVADAYLPPSATDVGDNESSLTTKAAEESAESEKWKQEKETAGRLFDRARMLDPHLDIPTLPADESSDLSKSELRMPEVNIDAFGNNDEEKPRRRRRKAGESMVEQANRDSREGSEDSDSTWYVWLPGLIGAGTALLAVGVIGAMSINWRKSQNS